MACFSSKRKFDAQPPKKIVSTKNAVKRWMDFIIISNNDALGGKLDAVSGQLL